MRSSALAHILIAEALRACIRGVGLYGEVRGLAGVGLVRELARANAVRGLGRELDRIIACGDLAGPVSTWAEIAAREQRLGQLRRALPATQSLLETAQGLGGDMPAGVLSGPAGELLAPVRGHLVAMDEAQLRAVEERLARTGLGAPLADADWRKDARGQARACIELLHDEAAAWRVVDTSPLANRLLLDRGFLDTYSQARKRARGVLRAHTRADGEILQPGELEDLLRWHRSVVGQLELLGLLEAGVLAHPQELSHMHAQARELDALLQGSLDILRLWKVLGGGAGAKRRKRARHEWPHLVESLSEFLRQRSAACLAALPRVYGFSKSNFRGLIGSETA